MRNWGDGKAVEALMQTAGTRTRVQTGNPQRNLQARLRYISEPWVQVRDLTLTDMVESNRGDPQYQPQTSTGKCQRSDEVFCSLGISTETPAVNLRRNLHPLQPGYLRKKEVFERHRTSVLSQSCTQCFIISTQHLACCLLNPFSLILDSV